MSVRWSGRTIFLLLVEILAVGLLAMACTKEEKAAAPSPAKPAAPATAPKAPEPPVSEIAAGVGSGTVTGSAFAPQHVIMPVGRTITWTNVPELGHQVTFFADGKPRPEGPPREWKATVNIGDSVQYDGSELVHSGVMSQGEKVSVTFPKEGSYKYFCPIHPRMEGTVTVVPTGQPCTTVSQAQADAKAKTEAMLVLANPNREGTLARTTRTKLRDGSTQWTVIVGPKVETPDGYLELREYMPRELKIKRGDTVLWFFETGHSVTFLPPGQEIRSPNARIPPAAKPSPDYDGKSLYNSGPTRPGPGGPGVFELRFPDVGTFPYICQLHGPIGHIGTVIVEPPS